MRGISVALTMQQSIPKPEGTIAVQRRSCLCLVLGAEVRVRQPRGHVQHEGVDELAHLVRHVDVLAASLDDNLPSNINPVTSRPCLSRANATLS